MTLQSSYGVITILAAVNYLASNIFAVWVVVRSPSGTLNVTFLNGYSYSALLIAVCGSSVLLLLIPLSAV